MRESKQIGKPLPLFVTVIALCLTLPLVILNNGKLAVGKAGFVRSMILRSVWILPGIILLLVGIMIYRTWLKKIICIVLGAASLCLGIYQVRIGLLDLPYLDHPQELIVSQLSFSDSADDEYNAIDSLYCTDEAGKRWHFNITDQMMKDARNTLDLDYNNNVYNEGQKARIHCYPNTKVLVDLEYVR